MITKGLNNRLAVIGDDITDKTQNPYNFDENIFIMEGVVMLPEILREVRQEKKCMVFCLKLILKNQMIMLISSFLYNVMVKKGFHTK
jgi:hypothetical protein